MQLAVLPLQLCRIEEKFIPCFRNRALLIITGKLMKYRYAFGSYMSFAEKSTTEEEKNYKHYKLISQID